MEKPLNDVYQNYLLTNQVNLNILLHTYFWTELSPIFKDELSAAYTYFKALSPTSTLNALGLMEAMRHAKWP